MRPSRRDILIATRRSRLAIAQSEAVGGHIHRLNPRVEMRLVTMDSEADRIPDRPLARFGGKGLFTRSIERALLEKRADIAVHSLKDMPTAQTPGLLIVAIPARMPAHDVLIARDAETVEELPEGATLGTSSPRRKAQLLRLRPDLNVVPLRGNVETRLRKVLVDKRVDATLLAAAGLIRLGLREHTTRPIPPHTVLPAAAQGALAVQVRADDHVALRRCLPLNDPQASVAVNAERQVVEALGADCHSPVAVLAEPSGADALRLRARVLSIDGATCLEADRTAPAAQLRALCQGVADSLIERGARQVLAEATRELAG